MSIFNITVVVFFLFIAIHDNLQRKHTIRAIYPIIGWFRWVCELIGDKIYQYFIENRTEGKPFSKDDRAYIHASSKKENNNTGFGSNADFDAPGHLFILPSMFPLRYDIKASKQLKCKKIVGKKRRKPYQPGSIINISGMSYGALSKTAVEAMNKGALIAGCYHTTGEGGFSPYHDNGADVVFQFGTGYSGVQKDGLFSMEKLKQLVEDHSCIKMIEVKLSQGAKPGAWSILPKSKMTPEIAAIRGLEPGQDSVSPGYHTAFSNVTELVNFIEDIASETGLPVGIKCAVGKLAEWYELAHMMQTTGRGPDYIVIDGGEGGTGSAKKSMTDHMGLPFTQAFTRVYKIFQQFGIEKNITWVGSGKLGFPEKVIKAMSLGCDMINIGREVMLSIGCIQSHLCHTNHCPSGVATQAEWRYKKLDPTLKSHRCANFIIELRKNITEMSASSAYGHPSEYTSEDLEINTGDEKVMVTLKEAYGY